MEKDGLLWYDKKAMEKIKIYAKEIWRIISPLLIFRGTTAAVVSAFGILWMLLGSRLAFLAGNLEDVTLLLSAAAALWAAWILQKIDGREKIWYGEIRSRMPASALIPCMGAALGASVAGNCLLSLTGITQLEGAGQIGQALELGTPAVVVFSTCVAAPLAEEMVFRVVIYRRLRRNLSALWSIGISSLLFALYHGNLPQGLYALAVGAVLAALMECYGSAAAPIAAHMTANTASVLLTWAGTGEILAEGMLRRTGAILIFGGILYISLRQAYAYWKKNNN